MLPRLALLGEGILAPRSLHGGPDARRVARVCVDSRGRVLVAESSAGPAGPTDAASERSRRRVLLPANS
jgi:hypothetical protein